MFTSGLRRGWVVGGVAGAARRSGVVLCLVWTAMTLFLGASPAAAQLPVWSKWDVTGPSGRRYHQMAYDSARSVTVFFGGGYPFTGNDTWEWSGTQWTPRFPASVPVDRAWHAMAFDAARGRVVLQGGYDGLSPLSETRLFNGTTWLTPSVQPSPGTHIRHAMVYDSNRQVCVMFGGGSGTAPRTGTREWNGTAWTLRTGTEPSPRYHHAMAFDSARGVTVLFGGYLESGERSAETWEWDGTTWTQRNVTGPSARSEHAMAYDAARGVTVLFGGETASGRSAETWEWDGAAWTRRMISGPQPQHGHAMVYHAARNEIVLHIMNPTSGVGETWVLGNQCVAPFFLSGPSMILPACRNGFGGYTVFPFNEGTYTYQWQFEVAPNDWRPLTEEPMGLPCGGTVWCIGADTFSTVINVQACPGSVTQSFRVRCLIANDCGSKMSNTAEYRICGADFNCSRSVTVDDLFGYFNAYFAGAQGADVNGLSGVTIDDLFLFLRAWFAGC